MPVEVQLNGLWAGFSLAAARAGQDVPFVIEGFSSSEDGEQFFHRLEHGPDVILRMLPNGGWINRGQIDHVLIIFSRDKKATVYLNELRPILEIRSRGKVSAGQGVSNDHIADVESLDAGITIPDDAGVMFVFSVGWRKGFYFDFAPLRGSQRTIDLKKLFGQFYARVAFQNLFSISDVEWDKIVDEKWFPFIGLSTKTRTEMINYVRAGWAIDDLTSQIATEVREKVPEFLQAWEGHPTFEDHIKILRRAVERFLENDFISCTGLLFPRIEGLMRANHAAAACTTSLSQAHLATSAVGPALTLKASLLLPQRFHEYLEKVYFASFAPRDLKSDVSRNSVGHGVAHADRFDQKSAAIGLLVTHQLLFFFQKTRRAEPKDIEEPGESPAASSQSSKVSESH